MGWSGRRGRRAARLSLWGREFLRGAPPPPPEDPAADAEPVPVIVLRDGGRAEVLCAGMSFDEMSPAAARARCAALVGAWRSEHAPHRLGLPVPAVRLQVGGGPYQPAPVAELDGRPHHQASSAAEALRLAREGVAAAAARLAAAAGESQACAPLAPRL